MRRLIILTFVVMMTLPLSAQTRQEALLEYQANKRKALTEYQSNYRKACADFMRRRWEAFNAEAPVAMPERKEPTEPVVKEHPEAEQPQPTTPSVQPEQPSTPVTQPTEEVKPEVKPTESIEPTPTPAPTPTPTPTLAPKPQSAKEKGAEPTSHRDTERHKPTLTTPKIDTSKSLKFTFYGTECSVSFNSTHSINLLSISESAVASAWQTIASGRFDRIFEECKSIKSDLNLNDWGYYRLIQTMADACYGASSPKSLLLQSFMMSEAGFKVRLARGDGRLWLLLAVNEKLYSRTFFRIDGGVFYLLESGSKASRYEVCNFSIPGERPLSLSIKELPRLTFREGKNIKRTDRKQGIGISTTTNANLVAFMQEYPPCDWDIYASAKLSQHTAEAVLPTLRKKIEGKGEVEAVQMLLSFIHNAFPYRADAQQFGVERTFFAEEMFAYDYSDCEDRAILFARLVRELVGLDVLLLHYPEHIAAAVGFKGNVSGDSVKSGQRNYVICDPTYVGADVGEVMPEYRNISAKLIKID